MKFDEGGVRNFKWSMPRIRLATFPCYASLIRLSDLVALPGILLSIHCADFSGLSVESTNSDAGPEMKDLLWSAQVWTVVSWYTYRIVYVCPMMGISGPSFVVPIKLGYSVSDIISKCGVGLLIYQITNKKSQNERVALDKQIEDAQKLINNAAVSM